MIHNAYFVTEKPRINALNALMASFYKMVNASNARKTFAKNAIIVICVYNALKALISS